MAGHSPSSPRSYLPPRFGKAVRAARRKRGWTQEVLAYVTGVSRETITRLETGCSASDPATWKFVPGEQLVRALLRKETLGNHLPSIKAEFTKADYRDRGLCAYAARFAAGLTLEQVAEATGISTGSLSSFERSLAGPVAIVGPAGKDDGSGVINKVYAETLGFKDAEDMSAYIDSDNPWPWLARIAKKHGRLPLPLSRLPTRVLPLPEFGDEPAP